MKITITPEGYICDSHETPIEGHSYVLIDAEDYTQSMRNLWEALVDEWCASGKYSFVDTIDKYKFREEVKLRYGQGFDRLKYVDDNKAMVEVKSVSEIPESVLLDFRDGNPGRVFGVVKSSTKYTKKQFTAMIDKTINAMQEAGVATDKFMDIIDTINDYSEGIR